MLSGGWGGLWLSPGPVGKAHSSSCVSPLYYHTTATLTTLVTPDVRVGVFLHHWFYNTSWMSHSSTQFWHCLPGNSVRSIFDVLPLHSGVPVFKNLSEWPRLSKLALCTLDKISAESILWGALDCQPKNLFIVDFLWQSAVRCKKNSVTRLAYAGLFSEFALGM